MFSLPRFTLRGLMMFVAAIAYCLGLSRVLGLVLGTFLFALIGCYVLASFLSLRARVICAACCSFFVLLPWLGLGHGAFIFPGATDSFPIILLPSVIEIPLSAFYWVAETPLYLVAADGNEFSQVIFFAGEGVARVRPFIVFVFWLSFAIVFALSVGVALYAKWRCGRIERLQGQSS